MRAIPIALLLAGLALAGALATAPSAAAAESCVRDVKETPDRPCEGIVCYGYTQGHWQHCADLKPPP
jgi:hypothetical protein